MEEKEQLSVERSSCGRRTGVSSNFFVCYTFAIEFFVVFLVFLLVVYFILSVKILNYIVFI